MQSMLDSQLAVFPFLTIKELCQYQLSAKLPKCLAVKFMRHLPTVHEPLHKLPMPQCCIRLAQVQVSVQELGRAIGEAECSARMFVFAARSVQRLQILFHAADEAEEGFQERHDVVASLAQAMENAAPHVLRWVETTYGWRQFQIHEAWGEDMRRALEFKELRCIWHCCEHLSDCKDGPNIVVAATAARQLAMKVHGLLCHWRPCLDDLAYAAVVAEGAHHGSVIAPIILSCKGPEHYAKSTNLDDHGLHTVWLRAKKEDGVAELLEANYEWKADAEGGPLVVPDRLLPGQALTWAELFLGGASLLPGALTQWPDARRLNFPVVKIRPASIQEAVAMLSVVGCGILDKVSSLVHDMNASADDLESKVACVSESSNDTQDAHVAEHPVLEDCCYMCGKAPGPSACQEQPDACKSDQVVAEIEHSDSAAVICPSEACSVERTRWESVIETRSRLAVPLNHGEDNLRNALADEYDQEEDDIFLIRLNRTPADMESALRSGPALRQCRDSLEAAGHSWKLLSGAALFVHPHQFRKVMVALNGFDLKHYHIVVSQSLEYLLEESIMDLGKGFWAKSRQKLEVVDTSQSEELLPASSTGRSDYSLVEMLETTHPHLTVERTFICTIRRMRRAESVTQSTTEANVCAGVNPRRVSTASSDF